MVLGTVAVGKGPPEWAAPRGNGTPGVARVSKFLTLATVVERMDVTIDAVRVALTEEGAQPIVVLAPDDDDDILPIFIRLEEGVSIARGMEAEDIGRPLTHDLLLDVMEELGGRVERVVVSELDDNTYIADLHIQTPRGETVIDARPSDSLALAARTNAAVEVADEVFEDGRQSRAQFDDLQDIRDVAEIGT